MIYTVFLYSTPDGGYFTGVTPADDADMAVELVVARHPELSLSDVEVIAVARGVVHFEPVSYRFLLFPGAPYMDPYTSSEH